jgi:hypothetical protein
MRMVVLVADVVVHLVSMQRRAVADFGIRHTIRDEVFADFESHLIRRRRTSS